MDDFREVGVLSDQVMTVLVRRRRTLSSSLQWGVGFLPNPLPPRAWASLAGCCPCDNALLRVRDAMGFTRLPVKNTSGEEPVSRPEALCLCTSTLQGRIRLLPFWVRRVPYGINLFRLLWITVFMTVHDCCSIHPA